MLADVISGWSLSSSHREQPGPWNSSMPHAKALFYFFDRVYRKKQPNVAQWFTQPQSLPIAPGNISNVIAVASKV